MKRVTRLCFAAWAAVQLVAAALECAADPRACACTGMDCRTVGKAHDELGLLGSPASPQSDEDLQFTSLLQTGVQLGGARRGDHVLVAEQRAREAAECQSHMKAPKGQWEPVSDLYFAEGLDHSQFWQSQMLHRAFFGSGNVPIKRGTVLEIGAGDGIKGSNSYAFEVGLGWRTILIEANPDSARSLTQNRPGAELHAPVAISASSGHVNFTMCRDDADRSRIDADETLWCQGETEIVQVPSEALSAFLEDTPELDILFLDVEGAELTFLDFDKTKIHVVNVELGCPGSAVGDFLESKGFVYRGNILQDFVWTWGV